MLKKLLKNTNGAVTVFVTLLLVPAVLISGTAVDLTRIFTARSIIQDAGQLAANSVLSQYDALLHDLYAIFGVAENDPVLAELLDEYISVTVFGQEGKDTDMGTLQLFYGSSLSLEEICFAEDKNLRNPDVLRRQIEEYMKFRAPVIIVKELLELLGSNTFKEDTEVIDNKLDIDEGIAELYEKYKELYEAIVTADLCKVVPSAPATAAGNVSTYLQYIRDEFTNLIDCYDDWKKCKDKLEELEENSDVPEEMFDSQNSYFDELRDEYIEKIDDLEKKYAAILNNFYPWIKGGKVGKNWKNGKWGSSSTVIGLEEAIKNAVEKADGFKVKFDDVVNIAIELDAMNEELTEKVNALEDRLNNGLCNPELKEALTQIPPGSEKSVIETYKDILKWKDIGSMATVYKDGGYYYIDEPVIKEMFGNIMYRSKNNLSDDYVYSQEKLVNAGAQANLSMGRADTIVRTLAKYTNENISYNMPDGFMKFGEYPGDNEEFYLELKKMMDQPDTLPVSLFEDQEEGKGEDPEEKQKNMIDELLSLVDAAYEGMTNKPLGAMYIGSGPPGSEPEKASDVKKSVSDAGNHPAADVIGDPYSAVARAGDYLLLMTYCTSMFSNYTTGRPDTNGKTREEIGDITMPKTAAGIPMDPKVNYFLQSEWEYLYHGSDNAGTNLSAVSRLIYLVRVICNYIAVFSVPDVNTVISQIRTMFGWNPPLAFILGELARGAFVAAESAVDLAALRAGYKVPLIKSGSMGEWVCSPKGLVKALKDVTSDAMAGDELKKDKGVSYSNYLLMFLLAKGLGGESAALELSGRTADLIEWNVINYKDGVFCGEDKMAQALSSADRFKLEDMKTDFYITTTADMRMLFLSMVFAQNFSDSRGIGIPLTVPVTITDYRGY